MSDSSEFQKDVAAVVSGRLNISYDWALGLTKRYGEEIDEVLEWSSPYDDLPGNAAAAVVAAFQDEASRTYGVLPTFGAGVA